MCEVLYRKLLDGRDKPIITCLEFIREYLMKKIVNVQKVIDKFDGPLTPNATRLFKVIKDEASKYRELTGMPCKHSVATINDMGNNGIQVGMPEAWVNSAYWLTIWKKMYSFKINPVNGQEFWRKSSIPLVLIPPDYHTPIGRPPKKRKKSASELSDTMVKNGKLNRSRKTVTCTLYRQLGHNKRSCKQNKDASAATATIKKKGSKQAYDATATTRKKDAFAATAIPRLPIASTTTSRSPRHSQGIIIRDSPCANIKGLQAARISQEPAAKSKGKEKVME
uniref:Transposase, mutator type n=1 Tax=Tanacetum cinerariifolium TaxID=118510 RepID=A0A6L2NZU8_TANCI|nr:hypothetical protein [Tanacetum cinerariifolium]